MCGICGCSDHHHRSSKDDEIISPHHHDHNLVQIEEDLLAKNNQYASNNRDFLLKKGITALNVMSSPGSGKTTLLAKTISDLNNQRDMAVIVADQQTDEDAQLLRASGARAIQVNTGRVCHLDSHMLGHTLETLNPADNSILFIENIGNLVCPALFDLGETHNVVILSVTEGDNKPIKYPDMFKRADLVLLTKVDLLPYVDFNSERCIDFIHKINPATKVLSVSTTDGTGLNDWYQWLTDNHAS